MNKTVLLFACALLSIECGSPATGNTGLKSNSAVAMTNVNAVTNTPYSLTENAYTKAANSSLSVLRPSVGKTANQAKLWQNKEIDSRLKKLMGADYETMRKFWNTETPIKKFGDFLMMTGCEQHNCGDNQYVIFVDTAVGQINVVHIVNGDAREWGDKMRLPPIFAEELAAMKTNK